MTPPKMFDWKSSTWTVKKQLSTAIHFLRISPENTGGRVLILVKLQNNCSEQGLYTKMTPPRMFSSKSSVCTV